MTKNAKLASGLALFWGGIGAAVLLPTAIETGSLPQWTPGVVLPLFFAFLTTYAADNKDMSP